MTDPEPPPDDDAFTRVRASWGFPKFAKDFPRDPELDALVAAFERGDFAAVRRDASALAERTPEEAVRKAALLLRERIEPDKAARVLFLFALGLLVFLSGYWVLHDGPPKSEVAPKIEIVK